MIAHVLDRAGYFLARKHICAKKILEPYRRGRDRAYVEQSLDWAFHLGQMSEADVEEVKQWMRA